MKRILLIFLLTLTTIHAQVKPDVQTVDLASGQPVSIQGCKFNFGDNPEWSKKEYDDSDWFSKYDINELNSGKGVFWYRRNIILKGFDEAPGALIISTAYLQSAYDVFWDGVKIGSNGQVGKTIEEEKTGKVICEIKLNPGLVSPGNHTIALRVSNFKGGRWSAFGSMKLGWEPQINHYFHQPRMFQHVFFTGAFFIAAILGFTLFWSGRKYKPYLIFAFICLLTTIWRCYLFLLEYLNLKSTVINFVRFVNYSFFDIITAGIIAFLVVNFEISNRRIHSVVIAVIMITVRLLIIAGNLPNGFNFFSLIIVPLYIFSLLFTAIKTGKSGSVFALIGYLFFISSFQLMGIFKVQILQNSWMFAYLIFIVTIILSISRQLQEQTLKQKELKIKSKRLENELLKKTIQPHFVMNTLQSIKSLSKSHPEKSVNLMEAFAEEFRIISQAASEKEITIQDEIRLCESHLKLMGYRWDAEYTLKKDGIIPAEKIPPLIFHTLIENGLTHSYKPKENGTFHLIRNAANGTIQFLLLNDGSLLEQFERYSQEKIIEGMGLKYVKARLEESYPDSWKLTYGMKDHLWRVVIEIKEKIYNANRNY